MIKISFPFFLFINGMDSVTENAEQKKIFEQEKKEVNAASVCSQKYVTHNSLCSRLLCVPCEYVANSVLLTK